MDPNKFYDRFCTLVDYTKWECPSALNRRCKYEHFLGATMCGRFFREFIDQYLQDYKDKLENNPEYQDVTFRILTLIAAQLSYIHYHSQRFFKPIRKLWINKTAKYYVDPSKFYEYFKFWSEKENWIIPKELSNEYRYNSFIQSMNRVDKFRECVYDTRDWIYFDSKLPTKEMCALEDKVMRMMQFIAIHITVQYTFHLCCFSSVNDHNIRWFDPNYKCRIQRQYWRCAEKHHRQ